MFSASSGGPRASALTSTAGGAFGQDGAGGNGSESGKIKQKSRGNTWNKRDGGGRNHRGSSRGDGQGFNKRGRASNRGGRGGPGRLRNAHVSGQDASTQGYSSAEESTAPDSDEPFAKRIQNQLRQDGISPPQWPDHPGSANSLQQMSQFRELHEEYRRRVRASLTKAGLIDDPEKRKRLSDAIEFKGICEDMCPEFEKITRITESDVNKPERDASTGVTSVRLMVKKLARSAAGQEAPLPMDVRSVAALRRSLDYLIDQVLGCDANLSSVHPFLWDRTRAIRRDFAFFSSVSEEEIQTQVYVLENITRFHVIALHLLSRPDEDDDSFVEQQELEQLGKTLLSLRDLYDDCHSQGIECENEAEFRAYYLIFHGREPSILETLQRQWKPSLWRDSDEVRTAVSLVEALQNTQEFIGSRKEGDAGPLLAASSSQLSFFRIVEDPAVSYTMACFAECHFPHLRRSILATVKRALARPKDPVQDVTTAALNQFLRFDTIAEAVEFAQLHNLGLTPDRQNPSDLGSQLLVLTDRSPLPHVRLSHQFSQALVERKRGRASLPQVIHSTVYEGLTISQGANDDHDQSEGSLFVQQASDDRPTESTNSSSAAVFAPSPGSLSKPAPAPSLPPAPQAATSSKSPFMIESDDDGDGPNGLKASPAPQKSNPFATSSGASTGDSSASGPRPSFSTFGGNDTKGSNSLFAGAAAQSGTGVFGQPSNGAFGQPSTAGDSSGSLPTAKPNPFAVPPKQPGASGENKSATADAPKPNPFAAIAKEAEPAQEQQPAQARPNLFGAAPQATSSAMPNGATAPTNGLFGKSSPSTFMSGPGSSNAPPVSSESSAPAQAKTNPFAALKQGDSSSTAISAFSGAKDASKPATSASSLFGQPSTAGQNVTSTSIPSGQQALPQLSSPSTFTNTSRASAPISSSPLPSAPLGALSATNALSASQTAAAERQATTTSKRPASASAEQPQTSTASASIPPSTSKPAAPPSISFGKEAESTQSQSKPAAKSVPAPPPRDLFGDFTTWFVKGDKGLLDDFIVDSVHRITKEAYNAFEKETRERKRREEEERTNAEIEKFRVYNLRLKFFYRWKRNAREKRLHEMRVKGREEMRAFYLARRAAEREAKMKAEADRRRASSSRPQELLDLAMSKRESKFQAKESLLSSGVLSGVSQERRAAKRIVNGDKSHSPEVSHSTRSPSSALSQSKSKDGPKTRALRKLLFGDTNEARGFRRSLPATSKSRDVRDPATVRVSNASPSWRLKAMGIVQLPDGTAIPESLASEMASKMARQRAQYPRPASSYTARRISATEAIEAELRRSTSSSGLASSSTGVAGPSTSNKNRKRSLEQVGDEQLPSAGVEEGARKRRVSSTDTSRQVEMSALHKRKRTTNNDDQGAGENNGAEDGGYERRISEARKMRMELQALRAELQEGAEWYREQNERLRSASGSGTSAWIDEGV